jgi:hypothetical protein
MSKIETPAKNPPDRPAVPSPEPSEDAVRDYAYHLYQQGGIMPGHDVDDWLEATACLKAHIPAHGSHRRLHEHVNGAETSGPLVDSPALAKREIATLRRGRESLDSTPTTTDLDMRTSLFGDHP